MSRAGSFDLDEATARLAAATAAECLGLPIIGLGWATVDTDRAVAELTRAEPEAAPFEPGVSEALLGGSSLLGRALAGRVRLVILEPSTESRLAATLARNDEGPAALPGLAHFHASSSQPSEVMPTRKSVGWPGAGAGAGVAGTGSSASP